MKARDVMYVLVGVAVIAALVYGVMQLRTRPEGFSEGDSFTLYYADWCPHCKAVKPVFAQWSSSGSVTVKDKTVMTTMVEADTSPDLVSQAGVKGFPTMMLRKANGTTMEYKGERTSTAWEEWLASNL